MLNRKLWVLNIFFKTASTLFFMSIFCFIAFFIVSRQGISVDLGNGILYGINIITFVSLILIAISLILIFLRKNSIKNKIKRSLILVFRFIICLVILFFVNIIYILSLGIME